MHFFEKPLTALHKAIFSKETWLSFLEYVGLGRPVNKTPITDIALLMDFLQSRSSHVAQSALYGYLKTRAGTRFPEMFENPAMLASINMAKWQIWLACLSDLTVYIGGLIHISIIAVNPDTDQTDTYQINELLSNAIDQILRQTGIPEEASEEFSDTADAMRIRIANSDFSSIPDDETAFVNSPESLYKWAPIADELKRRDKEIVENSIRFRWQEVRRSARRLLDAEALLGQASTSIPTV